MSDEAVWAQVEAGLAPTAARVAAVAASKRLHLGQAGVARHAAELSAAVLGAGPLEPWLHHPDVTDVLVNGIDGVLSLIHI